MTRWRLSVGFLCLLIAGLPLLMPLAALRPGHDGALVWSERGRLLELAWNTLRLTGGTLAIAMPLGVIGALLAFRTDVPGRRAWLFLSLMSLFVPLPLIATAWQMAGAWWTGRNSWMEGLGPAILVHAAAAWPWVFLLVGLGLSQVEPELEEDALTAAPPWRVLVHVTLPRASPAIGMAALAAALLTLNEIAVTDRFQVRTFAEEVYLQYVASSTNEALLALPAVMLVVFTTLIVVNRWRRSVPARQSRMHGPRPFPLGRWRWPCACLVFTFILITLGIPVAGLLWKAGLRYADAGHPRPPALDGWVLLVRMGLAYERQSPLLLTSAALALTTGVIAAFAALLLAWLARGSAKFEQGIWFAAAVLWAVPGPILGLGLLDAMQRLFDLPGGRWLEPWLWSRPTPLPYLWICLLRFGPFALAALWPVVRQLPRELEENSMLDGLTPLARFGRVLVPLSAAPLAWVALGVAVLTLGEVSGSKLVATPGFKTLAQHVFEQMHSGADTELASLCLVWLGMVGLGGSAVLVARIKVKRLWPES